MRRARVLVIAPFCSRVPTRGYEKFLRHHLPGLIQRFDVDLVTLDGSTSQPRWSEPGIIRQYGVKTGIFSKIAGLFSCARHGLPVQCAEFVTPAFQQHVHEMMYSVHYDNIICYMTRVFPAIPVNAHDRTIVFAIDPLWVSYRLLSRVSNLFYKVAYALEGYRIRRLDHRIMCSASRYALISRHDIRRYGRLLRPPRDIDYIPYGCDLASENRLYQDRDPKILIVSGAWHYAPNVRALRYLLEDVWPAVHRLGYFKLRIIGANIDSEITTIINRNPDVELVGYVDSIYDHLSNAFAALCLVDLDVGVQTKVLEAMSCGTPVICNSSSNNGVRGQHRKDLLIANSPREILVALLELYRSRDLWESISSNAYSFIERNFLWSRSFKSLISIIDEENSILNNI